MTNYVSPNSDLDPYIRVEIVEDGQRLAESMFQYRYKQSAPDFPLHILTFCRMPSGEWLPVAYMHATDAGDHLLGGGACVDDRILRKLDIETRQAISAAGGLYLHAVRWCLTNLVSYKAIFGYCGNRLAERIDLAAGFIRTPHQHLLVYFTRALPEEEKDRLIEAARLVGPF